MLTDEARKAATTIINATAVAFGVTRAAILGGGRARPLPHARAAASYMMRERLNLSLKQIGAALNRDHSSIHTALAKSKTLANTSLAYRGRLLQLAGLTRDLERAQVGGSRGFGAY